MHVLPTESDLHQWDQKMEPIKNFIPLPENSEEWEHGCQFCNGCSEPFDAVFCRKHHCRICGLTFCTRCTPHRHLLSGARGCGKCLSELIIRVKDEMLAQHTASPRIQRQQQTFAEATAEFKRKQQHQIEEHQKEIKAEEDEQRIAAEEKKKRKEHSEQFTVTADAATSSDDASPIVVAQRMPPPSNSVAEPKGATTNASTHVEDNNNNKDTDDSEPLTRASTEEGSDFHTSPKVAA
ncbi:Hypothetical protein, putative [Bodo saltans]|uniref:FYVE-type domain-containing protein n=1 Tax=Bodo saltans TaxID=75058 RepID=A0A0S4J929_BODSA|nr:Hypothetical protein, putative [Bodo saltans]|eukprot:CUG85163.1 Hypothetical protein, putative [Bodo saltans]